MKRILIIVGPIVLVIVIVLIMVNKKTAITDVKMENVNSTQSEIPAVSTNQQQPITSVTPDSGKQVPFTVNGGNFYFKPNIIKVKLGDVVSIKFINDEGFHNLIIDEFNVGTQSIKGGTEETITFTANKKGSFEYYCSIGTHRQMGMKGTLIVE